MSKKLFWIKLNKDFFDDPKILKIRSIAGGDAYTCIYLKLLLKSIDDDGIMFYEGIEPTMEAELALKIREPEINVKAAIAIFESLGLIQRGENDDVRFPQAVALAGGADDSKERVRRFRARKKEALIKASNDDVTLQCNEAVTECNVTCNDVTLLEKEIEEEKEEEIEKEEANASTCAREKTPKSEKFSFTLSRLCKFQNLSQEYQAKLKAKIDEFIKTNPHAMSYEDFENICIAKGYQYQDFNRAYLNWVKKDSNQKQGGCDVVDCEFIPETTQAPKFDDDYFAEIARSQYGR